jgi:hypothetical protein
MPSGYSSLGGQVRNPYAPQLDGRGVPIVSPGGSSSGSAVAVAAGLAAVAIGTETSGSLLVPASGGLHEVRGIRNLPLGSGRQGDRPAGEQLIPVRDAGPNHEVPKSHFFCLGTSAKDET